MKWDGVVFVFVRNVGKKIPHSRGKLGTAPDLAAKVHANIADTQASGVIKVFDNVNIVLK